MKTTIVKIISFAVLSAIICSTLFGCVAAKENADETGDMQTTADTVSNDGNSFEDYLAEEEPEYYRIDDHGGTYSYYLYNEDGSVAEEVTDCTQKPEISVTDSLLVKVTLGRESYYYDLTNQIFSEVFNDAYDELGTLLVKAEGRKIVVCDIFDKNALYKEFEDFDGGLTWATTGDETPFEGAEFIQDGASVRVNYISAEKNARYSQCFDIGSGSKFVVVDDWTNKVGKISNGQENEIIGYLRWYIGEVDYNTGCEFLYKITGTLVINGDKYFHCQAFYKMEGTDGSITEVPYAEFVLSENKTARYDCREGSEKELIVYTENNMM